MPFFAIGVGPGDPDLLTIKAYKIIRKLTHLFAPFSGGSSTALNIVASHISEKTIVHKREFPMKKGENFRKILSPIADEIIELCRQGETVGFITLGDPMLYSTFGYLFDSIRGRVEIEIISGINSFTACAGVSANILTEGDDDLLIVPASSIKNDDGINRIVKLLNEHDNVIIMKAGSSMPIIEKALLATNMKENAVVCKNVNQNGQEICSIDEYLARHFTPEGHQKNNNYFTTVLINKNRKSNLPEIRMNNQSN